MANSYFQFKQFRVEQDRCAMKISTDAVLLGALAKQDGPAEILDIGTGTGVIALMLAQRFPFANIKALEIDEAAAGQASQNFNTSPWKDRLELRHQSFQNFTREDHHFDLIVSNPPYFSDHLKARDSKRNIALHTDTLNFSELAIGVSKLLKTNGQFWLILPIRQFEDFEKLAVQVGLFPREISYIRDTPQKQIIRIVASFSFEEVTVQKTYIDLKNMNGSYSDSYSTLLRDFLLIF
jgi:tRNA1Val (adenine37-N6)-methyltransferase